MIIAFENINCCVLNLTERQIVDYLLRSNAIPIVEQKFLRFIL